MTDKEKILDAIQRLAKADPFLAENLQKFAEIAEKNKFIYNQAVNKLKSL